MRFRLWTAVIPMCFLLFNPFSISFANESNNSANNTITSTDKKEQTPWQKIMEMTPEEREVYLKKMKKKTDGKNFSSE